MAPVVTVVIACHDLRRLALLERAVTSALDQRCGPHVVVAVDHNPELVRAVQTRFPTVTVVENQYEQGASGTRNSGAEKVDTEFIAFLDDDAHARPGWLDALLVPFTDPLVVGTGGSVSPEWAVQERPSWFPHEFDWVVGASYRGLPTVTSPIRNVWAENMMVRRAVFEAVGGFRREFGKVGDRSRPEDTDLCIRMSEAVHGGRWVYTPDAAIEHHVPAQRSTFGFFVRRCYVEGRGKIEMSRLLGPQERLQFERDYVRRTLPSGLRRYLGETLRGRLDGLPRAGALGVGSVAAGVGAAAALLDRGGLATPPSRSRSRTADSDAEPAALSSHAGLVPDAGPAPQEPLVTLAPLEAAQPSVTVVIACFDPERLPLTLAAVRSVQAQDYPHRTVVVVDHNPELEEQLRAAHLDDVEVVPNSYSRGASGARNTGALCAGTDLVAFLDDDAVAEPGWLAGLVRSVDAPGTVGAGGLIHPLWEGPTPGWFPPEFGWVVGASIPSGDDGAVSVRNVWAGSMIVRSAPFQDAGGFRDSFGKAGRVSQPEDTELCLRLSRSTGGGNWIFAPESVVHHRVPAGRSTWRFFVGRCWSEGQGKASMRQVLGGLPDTLSAERAYLRRLLPRAVVRHVAAGVSGDPSGLARAGAVLAGTAVTAAGFAAGSVRGARPETALRPDDGS